MKLSPKFLATCSTLVALTISPWFLSAGAASAQTKGMVGSYVGAGGAFGVTDGGTDRTSDDRTSGGNIQGRVTVPTVPVSLRGSVLWTDDTSAIIPTLTYDIPIARNTNVYAGVGYSFVEKESQPTPLGNKDAVVLTTGVESAVVGDVILYGDAKLGINAYKGSPASAFSLQGGVGYRF